ncbi:hypothetical protein [Massilia sp. 9096]|uniref:hypothetical protein n=1 Tax=Massilia sp. 9096 TaxID=1500894 RepID=UPI000567FBAE|nr:hypothetical protein [Massilia sp. 9096]
MRRTAFLGAFAFALAALSAGVCLPSPAQAQAATQIPPQPGAPTAQQVQKAQQNRSDAEAYLRREEAAATGSRTQATDRANRNAGVPDEAAGASAAGSTRAGTPATTPTAPSADAPPAYGPVLDPRQPQSNDPARRHPAEVHDEADAGANPAVLQQPPQQGPKRNNPQASRRHPAWQNAAEPMAPRPLRRSGVDERAAAASPKPVPAPAAAPQPVVPSSSALNGCIGGSCTDAAGNRLNGIGPSGIGPSGIGTSGIGSGGNAGVSASGRLCNRSGATVQCF